MKYVVSDCQKRLPFPTTALFFEKIARRTLRQHFFLKKSPVVPYDSTFFEKKRLSYPTTALPGKRKACRTLRRHFLKKGSPVVDLDGASRFTYLTLARYLR